MPLSGGTLVAVVTVGAVLFVPGAAFLRALRLEFHDPLVAAGVAVGAGMALQPVLYLWLDALGVPVVRGTWWVLLGGAVLVLAWGRSGAPKSAGPPDENAGRPDGKAQRSAGPALLATVAVAGCALASRWWAARDVVVPRWGDSVHHTIVVDLIMRAEGVPADWRPYAELSTFSYHFGVHALTATTAWLTGHEPHAALIVVGQVLMVAGVLSAYALGAGLTGRPWVGVGAALAAGGLSPMPAYYLNWGRYTQLSGQVILPVACLLAVVAARKMRPVSREVAAAAVLVAGLALTHYVVTLLAALFVAVWLVVGHESGEKRGHWRSAPRYLAALAAAGTGAVLLAVPWLGPFAAGPLASYAVRLSTQAVDPAVFGVNPLDEVWGQAGFLVGWPLAAAAGAGLVVTALGRNRLGLLGGLWLVLAVAAASPAALGIPVSGVLKAFTVAVGLYALAGPLVGAATGVADAFRARGQWVLAVGVAVLAATLAWEQRSVLAPAHELVTANDRAALGWIEAETPPEAGFLVSSFSAFGGTVQAGDDAGWWLPYWTGRRSTLPPITVGTERGFDPGYREGVNRLSDLWHADLDSAATRAALDQAAVTHAFVGEIAVRNDALGSGQGLAGALGASPHWRQVHAMGDATVWERRDG